MYDDDTIVALATPVGKGGVAVIRVSGPLSLEVSQNIIKKQPTPKVVTLASFHDASGVIDEGLVLFFKGPHSFTGEDVLELHCHGGMIVVELIIKRILEQNVRLAVAGEFSKRAFLNNKIDLVQAEAIADLIDSQSENAARASIKTLQGHFSKDIHKLIDKITKLRIYVEAAIDFPDEELDLLEDGKVVIQYTDILEELEALIKRSIEGNKLREGIKIVLAGPPNAGKSTLLNALCEDDVAIVTNIAGTTRDVLRDTVHIDGNCFHLSDTAGIRDTTDLIELEGIKRAKNEIAHSDHILWVMEYSNELDLSDLNEFLGEFKENNLSVTVIANKCDKLKKKPSIATIQGKEVITMSAITRGGLDILRDSLSQHYTKSNSTEGLFIARKRHIEAMNRGHASLMDGFRQINSLASLELIAEDLKLTHNYLGEITGKVTPDELLGKIFSSFCIGK